jgi:two-component system sensor histidine kinase RegB
MDFHLKGMVLGLAVGGAGVVYFISSLNRALWTKQAELEQIREQMAEQRKLVEMSALAATVAHEVATPLGTIAVIGRDLETLQCNGKCGGQLREDARLIQQAIERCRRVLELAGQSNATPSGGASEPVTADMLYQRLSVYLTLHEMSRLRFKDAECSAGTVEVSLQEFVIMAGILIRNALDASSEDDGITLSWRLDSDRVYIEVSDLGSGMSEAVLAQATDPFFTTKPADKGMGLGLYLVRLFCERHGGRLALQSAPGEGTSACIQLPAAGGSAFV